MNIDDLSYLEDFSEVNFVKGSGVLVAVVAYASATGNSSSTITDTTTKARTLRNGVSIGIGRGVAVAIGNDPTAAVSVYGIGDAVFGRTKERYFPNKGMVVARGFVIAIDWP